MRVIWTLKRCSSRQIIHVTHRKNGWKASTVKTLITRLKNKGFINSQRVKNRNLYSPAVDEQRAANLAAQDVFKNICPMHAGRAINQLVKTISISRPDVKKLIKTLTQIEKTAPQRVKCNCLDADAKREVNSNEDE